MNGKITIVTKARFKDSSLGNIYTEHAIDIARCTTASEISDDELLLTFTVEEEHYPELFQIISDLNLKILKIRPFYEE